MLARTHQYLIPVPVYKQIFSWLVEHRAEEKNGNSISMLQQKITTIKEQIDALKTYDWSKHYGYV
jgi:hypothetical protein